MKSVRIELAAMILGLLAMGLEEFLARGPVSVVCGLLLIFVLPGFSVMRAVLSQGTLSMGEQALATLGTSLAISVCATVFLGATIGLTRQSVAVLLGFIVIAACLTRLIRSSSLQRRKWED